MTLTAEGGRRRPAHDWISPAQAAVRLGIGVRDVYRLVDRGDLPGYRIAGEIRLLGHEVDRYAHGTRPG
ncbi:MAG TPA: helix-turn-helix domain-containing protein [Acidimicrobiales bacterium]